jgi:TrmH family RNA methyltransferase
VPDDRRVTSVKSDRVTEVRGLRTRQGRRKAGRFLVEGPQAVASAIAAGIPIHEVFVDEDAGGVMSDLAAKAGQTGARVTVATAAVLAAMGETDHPQGVLAVCPLLPPGDLDAVMSGPGPVVVLEAMSDPGNVGTVIRTADAVGAGGVVLTEGSADLHNGKVVRSTVGSLFHLPVLPGRTVAEVVDAAHAHGRVVAVLDGDAEVDLFGALGSGTLTDRPVWIVGNEAHGVSDATKASADVVVRIPMTGKAESLNAAVAAAAVLYVGAYAAAKDSQ